LWAANCYVPLSMLRIIELSLYYSPLNSVKTHLNAALKVVHCMFLGSKQ